MQMEIYILVSRFKLFNQEYKQRVFADVLHSVLLIGHALNKILKDLINRSKLLQGFRIQFVYFFYFLSKKKTTNNFSHFHFSLVVTYQDMILMDYH